MKDKIYLCIEKLVNYFLNIETVSCELRSHVFEESAKREISDYYTDQNFRIIEIKKSAEARNPIMPYLTKTKKQAILPQVFTQKSNFKIKVLH